MCLHICLNCLNWGDVKASNNVNESLDLFLDKFSTGFELIFPEKMVKFNKNYHKINKFMTQGLLVSRHTKNTLHKNLLLNPTSELSLQYKQYRNLYNSLLRISKQLYYEENFKIFRKNPKKTWDLLNEVTSRSCKKNVITEISMDGAKISNPKTIANNFNNFFTSIGSTISDSVRTTGKNPCDYIPNPKNKQIFDIGNTGPIHVLDIIKSLPTKNSADLMGISSSLIKFVCNEICSPLSHIFNLSLNQGIFPEKLKLSRTVPIHKAGDKLNIDNYRPISLVSTISKILEKMVSINLTNYLQINKLISPFQFGFQKNLRTEHNLLNVTNFIGNALNNKEFCIGIFFDLKKAFDVVNHDILLKKLEKFGIVGNNLNWFKTYLSNRMQLVDINGSLSDSKHVNCSVLQGSILGPTLFLCFINDFPNSTLLNVYMFADDTTCLCAGKDLNALINTVNTEIQKMAFWYRTNKMAVNISKTKYILFGPKGKNTLDIPPIFYNSNDPNTVEDPSFIFEIERIAFSNPDRDLHTYKLLGVLFDENLSFDQHISYICKKLSRANFFLNRAKNFVSQKSLRSLYFALFHSHLLYCTNITSCASTSNLKKITTLQKKAVRILSGAKSRDHTEPLFYSLNILPFDKLVLEAKLKFMHSIYYNYSPPSFANIWRKNSEITDLQLRNNDDFYLPSVKLELFRKIPLYSFAKAWNDLGDTKFQLNPTTFSIELRYKLTENENVNREPAY